MPSDTAPQVVELVSGGGVRGATACNCPEVFWELLHPLYESLYAHCVVCTRGVNPQWVCERVVG